jgi:hypothetical protein
METLSIILTGMALVVSGVAAWAAIRSVVLTKRGLETQHEQLRLQREQAAMIPELECSDVRFLDPASVEEILDTMQEAEKGRQEEDRRKAEREQYQRNLAAWEARSSVPGMGSSMPKPQDPEASPLRFYDRVNLGPLTSAQRYYRGPVPDVVMEVEIHNKGRTAAKDITGFVSLDGNLLELLDFPGLDSYELAGPYEDGFLTAEIGTISELLPKQKDSLRVAIAFHLPPEETTTDMRYEFITPAGHAAKGDKELTLPGPVSDQLEEQEAD